MSEKGGLKKQPANGPGTLSPDLPNKWGEKRQHLRRKGQVRRILLSDTPDHEAPTLCWVTDRSRGGLGIVADRAFVSGALLAARPADAPDDVPWVQLQVRNCRRKGKRWHIGCQFAEELPWSVVLLFG
jgi:hypothetical protein